MRMFKTLVVSVLIACFCHAADASRKVKKQIAPQYPELARQMGISGTVRLELVVDRDGSVKEVKALGGSPVLIVAAEQAAKKWQYETGSQTLESVEFHFHPTQ